jgi:uncharacterized protein YjbI with pentapeptide repeats
MKTVKPQRLSLLSRTYEHRGAFQLSIAAVLFFDLEQPRRLLTEVSLWKTLPPELGKDAGLDLAVPKARAEFLVTGHAFPIGGAPATACAPRAVVGRLDKTLHAIGDRTWNDGVATAPVPFRRLSLGWENAYGGAGYEQNPLGKGAVRPSDGKGHPLPNVEDPRRPIRTTRDRPAPAGFGPVDGTWPQRAVKQGTYDKRWLETAFPGFPADLDWTFFNVAPEDQWQEAPFRPDEPFRLEFMHPERSRIEGRLPGAVARCLVSRKGVAGEGLVELPLRLDTLWFFPHLLRGVMIFHGAVPVAEDDGADVLHLVAAIEEAGKPRPLEHYRKVLAERLDEERGALALLREADLVPDWPGLTAMLDPDPADPIPEALGLLEQNQRRARAHQLAQLRAEVAAAGIDPDTVELPSLDPGEPAPKVSADDPGQMLAQLEQAMATAEAARARAESETAKQKALLREQLRAQGIDPAPVDAPPPGGPPHFDAREELARIRALRGDVASAAPADAPGGDAELEHRLLDAERQVRDAYRWSAHRAPAAAARAPEAAIALREALCAAIAAGESLDGRDLTGADLTGLALPGADLAGAFLEGATLRGADLRGADLSRAVLARAELSGADLSGARLRGTNLGAATLRDARLCGADLTEAILGKADLARADLGGANLDKADLSEATLQGASLASVQARGLKLVQVDLSGVGLAGADLTKATFVECSAEAADFTGAQLESAVFFKARARRAVFQGARLAGACWIDGCDLEQADLREALLDGANLRGAKLAGAKLAGAHLNGADLSEADLRGAALGGIAARESRWVRADFTGAVLAGADLMGAIFQKADLSGASFQGANLYQADLARVALHERIDLTGANVKKLRVQPTRVR